MAKIQFELYIQISEITKSSGPIFSARKKVSPQIRSSIIHGTFLDDVVVIHKQVGTPLSYVKISHPDIPLVCGTRNVLSSGGTGFLKTRR